VATVDAGLTGAAGFRLQAFDRNETARVESKCRHDKIKGTRLSFPPQGSNVMAAGHNSGLNPTAFLADMSWLARTVALPPFYGARLSSALMGLGATLRAAG